MTQLQRNSIFTSGCDDDKSFYWLRKIVETMVKSWFSHKFPSRQRDSVRHWCWFVVSAYNFIYRFLNVSLQHFGGKILITRPTQKSLNTEKVSVNTMLHTIVSLFLILSFFHSPKWIARFLSLDVICFKLAKKISRLFSVLAHGRLTKCLQPYTLMCWKVFSHFQQLFIFLLEIQLNKV